MDIFSTISENKFTLVMMNEQQYEHHLIDMVKNIQAKSRKICYVCLSKPYRDVIAHLESIGLFVERFFFIDVLSSHYHKQKETDNCIFVDDPTQLVSIQKAIQKAVVEKKCDYIVFDTISSLLMYEQNHDIVRFTHNLTLETKERNVNKVFIVMKDHELLGIRGASLVKDVEMFADKTIDVLSQ